MTALALSPPDRSNPIKPELPQSGLRKLGWDIVVYIHIQTHIHVYIYVGTRLGDG